MTEEDEEFNRIEREAAMRKETVKEHMTKDEQIKGMANPNRGSVGVQEAQPAPVQEPVAWIDAEKRTFEWNGPVLWNTPTVAVLDKIPLYTTPPAAQRTERNFCERCGKRLLKGFHIHTCTPPKENT